MYSNRVHIPPYHRCTKFENFLPIIHRDIPDFSILHICNLWIKIVIYLVGQKFYLHGLFCYGSDITASRNLL